jgi:pyruvate dehydrogenase E2 component (dihydrolipoamide acetyltransferase)
MAVEPKQDKPQAKAEAKPEAKPEEKPTLSKEEERVKMLSEGTKPSDIKVKVLEPKATTIDSTPPVRTAEELKAAAAAVREISVPEGVTLVVEPHIVSTAGQLEIEPRKVSTGGVVHLEAEPKSLSPGVPGTEPAPEPAPEPKVEAKTEPKSGTPGKAS